MNVTAANQQKQNAALRVFFMFIAMALVMVRAGLDARGAVRIPVGQCGVTEEDGPAYWVDPSAQAPDHLYPAARRFLCAARVISDWLDAQMREPFELINLADRLAGSLRERTARRESQSDPASEPLDSS